MKRLHHRENLSPRSVMNKGRRPKPPRRSTALLLLVNEMPAAVLLPARFVAFRAERPFLAVADGADAVAGNTQLHQRLLGSVRAVVSERQIVLGGTTLVAVSLDGERHFGMLLQEVRIRLQNLLILRLNVVAVVGEEHVLHVLREQHCVALVGGWRRR